MPCLFLTLLNCARVRCCSPLVFLLLSLIRFGIFACSYLVLLPLRLVSRCSVFNQSLDLVRCFSIPACWAAVLVSCASVLCLRGYTRSSRNLVGHFDGVLYLVVVLRLLYLRGRLDCLGCAVCLVCVFLWFSSTVGIGNSKSSSVYCNLGRPKNFPSSFEVSGSPAYVSVSQRGRRNSAQCTGSALCPSFSAPSSCASRLVCRCAAPGKAPGWLAVLGQFTSRCVSIGLLITC